MKLAALYSGGKDSTFAIMEARKKGNEITHLITIAPKKSESYMFHYPCVELTKLQAEAMGTRQIWKESSGEKESELEDLKAVLENLKEEIDGVLSGAVSSQYQKSRIDAICKSLNIESVAPLWGKDAYDLLREEVGAGLDIIMTAVSTGGLGKVWLGKKLDALAVEELRALARKLPFNVQFEGGEAETFVTDCPLFKQKILIEDFEKVWDERTGSGHIVVRKSSLTPKKI